MNQRAARLEKDRKARKPRTNSFQLRLIADPKKNITGNYGLVQVIFKWLDKQGLMYLLVKQEGLMTEQEM